MHTFPIRGPALVLKSSLLRGIVIVSLCSVLFLPVYTFYYLYPAFERIITERTEEEAERFASHMANMFFTSDEDLTKDSITPLFRQGVDKIAKDMQLIKVKVFSPAGEIIYSTDRRETGEINSRKYFRDIVAKGRAYTQVVRKSSRSLEDQVMTRDVVETYVPLMKGEHFIGAFELYYDITKSRERFKTLVSRSSIIMFGVALGLLIGVIISALNAMRSLQTRDASETELRRHRDHLEQLVETRTRQIEKEMIEKRQMESSLLEAQAKYRSLVESTEDSIYLVDADCCYLFMNKKHAKRMALSPEQFMGHAYSEFHSPEETSQFVENVKKVFRTGESLQHEHQSKRDGRYFLQTLSPAKDQDGKVIAVTVVSKDISDRKRMEEELRTLSLTDELTGLYNRRGFVTLAEQYFKIANRMKNKVSVLYADLDGLKGINDTLGHQAGDVALTETASLLRNTFRESDIVARIGGDEFVVMPVIMSSVTRETIAARIHDNIAAINAQPGRKFQLSISYGIAVYDPEHPCSTEALLDQGDRLMYENKRGKNAGSRDLF
ncbi:MAG TPA: GGDEF domain-containing protein [Thermodesulfovibrionales bacterium]|nr:GGDEF domain-containing protein [Thermodesulfovibrionales bacterium]